MKFKVTYEIDTETMAYKIKIDDRGMTDEECRRECAQAIVTMSSHFFYDKPNAVGVH